MRRLGGVLNSTRGEGRFGQTYVIILDNKAKSTKPCEVCVGITHFTPRFSMFWRGLFRKSYRSEYKNYDYNDARDELSSPKACVLWPPTSTVLHLFVGLLCPAARLLPFCML